MVMKASLTSNYPKWLAVKEASWCWQVPEICFLKGWKEKGRSCCLEVSGESCISLPTSTVSFRELDICQLAFQSQPGRGGGKPQIVGLAEVFELCTWTTKMWGVLKTIILERLRAMCHVELQEKVLPTQTQAPQASWASLHLTSSLKSTLPVQLKPLALLCLL